MHEQKMTLLPLQGKRVLVTRAREQAAALSSRLQALGAIPIEFPAIRIVPPQNWESLDTALRKLFLTDTAQESDKVSGANDFRRGGGGVDEGKGRLRRPGAERSSDEENRTYSWLVFTSANAVHICCDRLLTLGYHPQALNGVRVAAIGPATAAALAKYGITADLLPDEYIAESVAAALKNDALQLGESLEGKRILLPRAAEARKILVTELQQAGAVVDEVAAYHTLPVAAEDEQGQQVWHLLQTGQIDIITFTSSSTVRSFMQWLNGCGANISHVKVACIGPITSQTAREFGLEVHIEAQEFTINGLVEAILEAEE
ncbi:MAG: hypothetical protein NVSMB27_28840 [Ktedonobacteraceae bacterium]